MRALAKLLLHRNTYTTRRIARYKYKRIRRRAWDAAGAIRYSVQCIGVNFSAFLHELTYVQQQNGYGCKWDHVTIHMHAVFKAEPTVEVLYRVVRMIQDMRIAARVHRESLHLLPPGSYVNYYMICQEHHTLPCNSFPIKSNSFTHAHIYNLLNLPACSAFIGDRRMNNASRVAIEAVAIRHLLRFDSRPRDYARTEKETK